MDSDEDDEVIPKDETESLRMVKDFLLASQAYTTSEMQPLDFAHPPSHPQSQSGAYPSPTYVTFGTPSSFLVPLLHLSLAVTPRTAYPRSDSPILMEIHSVRVELPRQTQNRTLIWIIGYA